jgi:hypothetical protein
MFQSKNFGKGEAVDFENFVAIIQSLGFQGSNTNLFTLFREANLFGGGVVNVDSFLKAMDSLSFHFYSIEVPLDQAKKIEVTKLARNQIMQHWTRFGGWFNAFKQPISEFDPWLRSTLIALVRRGETVFNGNAPVSVLFSEYRQLLDFFQFALDVLARAQKDPMPQQKSERQLGLLENLVDLLVTFIVRDEGGQVQFTEGS